MQIRAALDLASSPSLDKATSKLAEVTVGPKQQESVNLRWALGTSSGASLLLCHGASMAALEEITGLGPHDLSGVVWWCSFVAYSDGVLVGAAGVPLAICLPAFKPQDVANTAWCFANLGFRYEPFLTAIAAASLPTLQDFYP